MEKKNNGGLIVAVVILTVLFLASAGYIVYDKFIKEDNTNNQSTNNNSNNVLVNDKLSNRKFILTKDGKEYLSFDNKGNYEYMAQRNSAGENPEKTTGTYKIEDNKAILSNDSKKIYIEDSYLLIEGLISDSETVYHVFVDSNNYDQFIKNVSMNITTYLTKIVNEDKSNSELKKVLDKIEVGEIKYCYSHDINSKDIDCSVDYNVYLKNYDKNKASEYMGYFAGFAPEFNDKYVERWSFFALKYNNGKYEVKNTYTGY